MFAVLAVIYFLAQSYLLMMLTNSTEENVQRSIYIAEKGIEDSLKIVDSFIYEALYSGTSQTASQLYNSLRYETDPVELSTVRNTVVNSLKSIVTWSEMIDFILIYTGRQDADSWLEAGGSDNFAARQEMKRLLSDQIEGKESGQLGRYTVFEGEQRSYMIRLLKIEGSYFIVCVSEQEILETLLNARYSEDSIAFAAGQDGRVIFSSESLESDFSLEQEGSYIEIQGKKYLQTGYFSEKTGYYFGMLTSRDSIMENMWIFRMIFFLTFVILLGVVPLSFYVIHSFVEKPVREIANTMDQLSGGDLDIKIEERYRIEELSRLALAFNQMMERIKQLKIEKYEVKLEAQKATMQYLQLQVKPHFYANVLNIIYSLAERKEYETIQKISKAIVNYSRYMFRDATELVELQREIEHVQYYMEIQEIRYMTQIACEIQMPENTKSALVPPFIIQNFVENSVKYAFSTQKSLRIRIQIQADEDREYLTIRIHDNGEGYSEALLRQGWKQKKEEGHIGLANVYKRLRLIYEEKADIKLLNENGAVTIIRIPYIAVDYMEDEL